MATKTEGVKRFFLRVDKVLEGFAIFLLVMMIVIVTVAVFTRKLFGFVFPWSEEVTLLCLTWFSFLGIAIGFREDLHLGMDMLDSLLSKKVAYVWDRVIDAVVFLFGLYLVVYGWEFAWMMRDSILAATQWPNMVQYVVMPITGVLTCVYSALRFLGKDLRRFNVIEEEIKKDAE